MARRSKAPPRGETSASKQTSTYPGRVRIIGGRWRSRLLDVTSVPGLRPTPDRVRETLFNWLMPYIEGASCLDLFAGTGALCLEALSRGASRVVMVERAPDAVAQLRTNVGRLEAAGAEVMALDALEYLAGRPAPFDIVFLDPPFASAATMIRACGERLLAGWVKASTLVYVEAPRDLSPPLPDRFRSVKHAAAGQVGYHLFQAA